jgi:hypothetical protein
VEKGKKIMRNLNTNRTGYNKGKGEQKKYLKRENVLSLLYGTGQ